jgi:hypothetical protein
VSLGGVHTETPNLPRKLLPWLSDRKIADGKGWCQVRPKVKAEIALDLAARGPGARSASFFAGYKSFVLFVPCYLGKLGFFYGCSYVSNSHIFKAKKRLNIAR